MKTEVLHKTWPGMKLIYSYSYDDDDGTNWCRWECSCKEVGHWIDLDISNARVLAVQYWNGHVTEKHELKGMP